MSSEAGERTASLSPRERAGVRALERSVCTPDSESPLLLHARDPRRGLLVVACNAAAGASGVRLGMPLAEAATLVEQSIRRAKILPNRRGISRGHASCERSGTGVLTHPARHIFPHDPAADLAALAGLAEHCERFSPLVGWETAEPEVKGQRSEVRNGRPELLGPDCLFLDITGIGVLFGGEEQLARELAADLAHLGYQGHIGVADSVGAAWAAAHEEQESQVSGFRFQVVDASIWNLKLETWNLKLLRLPQATLDLLSQLGLTTLRDLLALPRESLTARFGPQLLLRLDQLAGAAGEMIVPHRPPPQFQAEWVLEYPLDDRRQIDRLVHELVGRVALALAERREGVVQLRLRLDCAAEGGSSRGARGPVLINVGLFRPSAAADHLWQLVEMQLEQARLPGALGRATLAATVTAPLENRQGELFAGSRHEAFRQLALLIDRLTSRLGPQSVLHAEPTADPLPERAIKYFAGIHRRANRSEKRRSKRSDVRSRRPAVLSTQYSVPSTERSTPDRPPALHNPTSAEFRPLCLHVPQELDVVSIVPDGPPLAFRFQGRLHRVAHHWGPERIETGWWRGASIRRDYYRVQTEGGLRFWLFRNLPDNRWHLQGTFS
jgi:protein ImuB